MPHWTFIGRVAAVTRTLRTVVTLQVEKKTTQSQRACLHWPPVSEKNCSCLVQEYVNQRRGAFISSLPTRTSTISEYRRRHCSYHRHHCYYQKYYFNCLCAEIFPLSRPQTNQWRTFVAFVSRLTQSHRCAVVTWNAVLALRLRCPAPEKSNRQQWPLIDVLSLNRELKLHVDGKNAGCRDNSRSWVELSCLARQRDCCTRRTVMSRRADAASRGGNFGACRNSAKRWR